MIPTIVLALTLVYNRVMLGIESEKYDFLNGELFVRDIRLGTPFTLCLSSLLFTRSNDNILSTDST